MIRKEAYIVIACLAFVSSCSSIKLEGYDLGHPTRTVQLEDELDEISGLHWLSDSTIACVQDEKAHVYFLDIFSGEVKSKFDFGHNGDFEGITMDGDYTYVLRSDGNVFISKDRKKAKEYKFKKEGPFDFEGLCLDSGNDRLLVACKEHGKEKKRDHIFIYSFSLKDKKYNPDPLFKMEKAEIHPNFRASGIAIHPISGDIYVLSSFSKTILVLTAEGEVKKFTQLNEYIYHQPEGICFSADGNMFISNEKHETYPTLIKINQSK